MKQYKIKTDFNKMLYILITVVVIIAAFAIFSILTLIPIYLLSKYYSTIYSWSSLSLLLGVVLTLFFIKFKNIYKKYMNGSVFMVHLLMYYLVPPIIIIGILFIEALIFQVVFALLPWFFATAVTIFLNAVLLGGLIMLRRSYHYIKQFLHKNIKK